MHKILITDDIGPAGLEMLDLATDMEHDLVKLPSHARLL